MSDGSEFNVENYVSETGGLLREVWDIEQGSLTLLINWDNDWFSVWEAATKSVGCMPGTCIQCQVFVSLSLLARPQPQLRGPFLDEHFKMDSGGTSLAVSS